jgi:hypothetical protein
VDSFGPEPMAAMTPFAQEYITAAQQLLAY